jgi:hypothetical protein
MRRWRAEVNFKNDAEGLVEVHDGCYDHPAVMLQPIDLGVIGRNQRYVFFIKKSPC